MDPSDDKYGPHTFLYSNGQMFELNTLIDSSLYESQAWPDVALTLPQASAFTAWFIQAFDEMIALRFCDLILPWV